MTRTDRDRIMQLEELMLELSKRLAWAQENADMRKISLDKVSIDRDNWRTVAYNLARLLGKPEYADAEYQDVVDSLEKQS